MNTEINLLMKKHNKYLAPLFFGAIFVIGFIIVFGLLLFQQSSLNKQITKGTNDIMEMEIILAEHQKTFASQDKIKKIDVEVIKIMNEITPHMPLYHQIVEQLPNQKHLITYAFNEKEYLNIDVEFLSLDDIAHYIAKLNEQRYIIDTELTQVYYNDPDYQASLTLQIDQEVLKEEFDKE